MKGKQIRIYYGFTMEENNAPIVEEGKTADQRFSFVKRTNRHRPIDNTEPLTVIEFSLTNDMKQQLQTKLEPFVLGQKTLEHNAEELKEAIKNNFPDEVISYFTKVNHITSRDEIAPYVYVVHNLPEPDENISKKIVRIHQLDVSRSCYSHWLGEGIALITDNSHNNTILSRFVNHGDTQLSGSQQHRHNKPFSAISTLFLKSNTKNTTRFTDLPAVMDEAMQQSPNNSGLAYYCNGIKEHSLHTVCRGGLDPMGVSEELVQKHSQEINNEPGMIIIWSDHGKLFHQAIATEFEQKEPSLRNKELLRSIMVHTFDAPDQRSPTVCHRRT